MRLIDCDPSYADAILAIFNDAIVHTTALYDYQPRTREMMETWFRNKQASNLPVIGLVDDAGELMGFASYGPFRMFPAYKYTVEHSVYVEKTFRGLGLGRKLLTELIARAEAQQYHAMIGVIDSQNGPSIRMHEHFGFKIAGTLPEVGFKFGRWLDVCFYQLILKTPSHPVDG